VTIPTYSGDFILPSILKDFTPNSINSFICFASDRSLTAIENFSFVFIFFLLAVALVAAYYVYDEGIKREGKLTYKLLLRCIIIITSVVPAELPIELSLAINNSLLNLQAKKIVCIEPFRIPFAGKVNNIF